MTLLTIFWEYMQKIFVENPYGMECAFWLSFISTIIVSICKNFINCKVNLEVFYMLILELPIDVCWVIVPIIATGFMAKNTILGFVLIFTTLLFVTIACILRRLGIEVYYKSKEALSKGAIIYAVLDLLCSCVWISIHCCPLKVETGKK